ncbi:MAG: tetratricopeptide repeat protein [Gammaproteobacteria bacterium]|nr:tetratricopeptide repeat protein [Candidatus Thioaporhodococcus sediminis]TNF55228.1 MAG: tetratricopeptide repeat protein [Gammaproteobacteria bacterium]
MNVYETDDEKVEAIKSWWKENGTSVAGGLIIGLAAVFGWRAWQDHRESQAQEASAAFEQLVTTVESGNNDAARSQAGLLLEKHGDSAYGALTELMLARVEIAANQPQAARQALERAMTKAPEPGLAKVAALRLARLLIAQGDLAAAMAIITKEDQGGPFAADFAALRGDLALADGRVAEARADYERAISQGAANTALLQLKLENLPPAG